MSGIFFKHYKSREVKLSKNKLFFTVTEALLCIFISKSYNFCNTDNSVYTSDVSTAALNVHINSIAGYLYSLFGQNIFGAENKDDIILSLVWDYNKRQRKNRLTFYDECKYDGTASRDFWDDAQP